METITESVRKIRSRRRRNFFVIISRKTNENQWKTITKDMLPWGSALKYRWKNRGKSPQISIFLKVFSLPPIQLFGVVYVQSTKKKTSALTPAGFTITDGSNSSLSSCCSALDSLSTYPWWLYNHGLVEPFTLLLRQRFGFTLHLPLVALQSRTGRTSVFLRFW